MISRILAVAGLATAIAAAPAAANDGRVLAMGAGSAAAAFGLGAALLGTHAPQPFSAPFPAPSVIYLPPVVYAPPTAAPPVVYAPSEPRS
jgi:hypothetical protein